jgi:hypothetical protein
MAVAMAVAMVVTAVVTATVVTVAAMATVEAMEAGIIIAIGTVGATDTELHLGVVTSLREACEAQASPLVVSYRRSADAQSLDFLYPAATASASVQIRLAPFDVSIAVAS